MPRDTTYDFGLLEHDSFDTSGNPNQGQVVIQTTPNSPPVIVEAGNLPPHIPTVDNSGSSAPPSSGSNTNTASSGSGGNTSASPSEDPIDVQLMEEQGDEFGLTQGTDAGEFDTPSYDSYLAELNLHLSLGVPQGITPDAFLQRFSWYGWYPDLDAQALIIVKNYISQLQSATDKNGRDDVIYYRRIPEHIQQEETSTTNNDNDVLYQVEYDGETQVYVLDLEGSNLSEEEYAELIAQADFPDGAEFIIDVPGWSAQLDDRVGTALAQADELDSRNIHNTSTPRVLIVVNFDAGEGAGANPTNTVASAMTGSNNTNNDLVTAQTNANAAGVELGEFVTALYDDQNNTEDNRTISLTGHSLGAQVILDALVQLSKSDVHIDTVAILQAAVSADERFDEGGLYYNVLSTDLVQNVVLGHNSLDPALQVFDESTGGAKALGRLNRENIGNLDFVNAREESGLQTEIITLNNPNAPGATGPGGHHSGNPTANRASLRFFIRSHEIISTSVTQAEEHARNFILEVSSTPTADLGYLYSTENWQTYLNSVSEGNDESTYYRVRQVVAFILGITDYY